MTQFYSRIDTEFNGDVYSIPFSYSKQSEISVYIDDKVFNDWQFLNESQIQLTKIPTEISTNSIVSIRRNTNISEKIIEYTNNTMLSRDALNLSQDQLLNAVQEIYDNNVQFEINTNDILIQNKIDLEEIIESNKQEIFEAQDNFKTEINTTIEEVNQAAAKINKLEEAVKDAQTAAASAIDSAQEAQQTLNETNDKLIKATEQANNAAQSAQESANVLDNFKDDIQQEAQIQLDKIKQTGFYMQGGKLYYIDPEGNEQEFKKGGSGLPLGTPFYSDHILEGDDAKGNALLGSYIYKNAAPGRYGHPEFYNRWVAEYHNSTRYAFEQPVLSANGTLGGDSFAVAASSQHANIPGGAWNAFNGTNTGVNDCWHSSGVNNEWFTFYNPLPINVTKLTITNRNATASGDWHMVGSGTVYGSNDNSNWEELVEFTNPNTTTDCGNASWDIDLSSNNKSYKYYKLQVNPVEGDGYVVIGKLEITAGSFLLKHSNGHRFYDIADKSSVDDIFDSTGVAWFYGVDEENERIFLPRSVRYFKNGSLDTVEEFGRGQVPNIKGRMSMNGGNGAHWWSDGLSEGALFASSVRGGTAIGNINASAPYESINIDASRSNSVYSDDATTVDVDSTNLLVYMVVGTTEGTSAPIDAIDITTSENDTIPLGFSTYQGAAQPSLAWLAAKDSWEDGNEYVSFFNEFKDKVGQSFCNGFVRNYTDEYTQYDLVINQDGMKFRLPLLNGSENLIDYSSGIELKDSSLPYTFNQKGELLVRSKAVNNNGTNLYINNEMVFESYGGGQYAGNDQAVYSVKNGDTITSKLGTFGTIMFYPAKGNGTLYFKVSNAVQNLEVLNAAETKANMLTRANKAEIIGWGLPDYSAGVVLPSGSAAPSAGVVMLNSGTIGTAWLYINGEAVLRSQISNTTGHFFTLAPIDKDEIVTATGIGGGGAIQFYPLKGVSN